jgi:hypothetical protein
VFLRVSLRDRDDARLHLTALALSAGSCSVPLVLDPVPGGGPSSLLGRRLVILLGPAAGWTPALASHQVAHAFGFLLTWTLVCATPLGISAATRHPGWLCVAAMAWVVTGWLLGVAIWA